jgi:hypothetical protein
MDMMTRMIVTLVLAMSFCCSCRDELGDKEVHRVTKRLPDFAYVNVRDSDKFLNDLKLSPMWKVEKDRGGYFMAVARSVAPESPFDESGREFLFELLSKEKPELKKDHIIHNRYIRSANRFSSFSAKVLFRKLDISNLSVATPSGNVTLRIFESFGNRIGSNSFSQLALKLSDEHDIYLLLCEQGSDKSRRTTFQKLISVTQELEGLTKLPKEYRVDERYKDFLEMVFDMPLKDQELRRFPGIQDRDTFYGYFKASPKTNYEGINIKISHPIYCPDEGTRKYSRLRKAEYVGTPYQTGDAMFFLIEDNAVYLNLKYSKQFGTFSGTGSFNGTLEVLNGEGSLLLKTTEKFKGWER